MGLRRKRLPPDDRLKWNDPELRAWCTAQQPNGYLADSIHEFVKERFIHQPQPLWRYDPSYNWAAKSKKS